LSSNSFLVIATLQNFSPFAIFNNSFYKEFEQDQQREVCRKKMRERGKKAKAWMEG